MRIVRQALLGVLLLIGNAPAQVLPDASSIPVSKIEIVDRTMNILQTLAEKYQVVIGVQGALIGSDSKRVRISLNLGTLKDVLDAIMSQDPRFAWHQNSNGSIHFAVQSAPLLLADITVSSFDIENPKRMETVQLLNRIPEISAWLQQHGCFMDEMWAGPRPKEWAPFSVHIKSTPLSSVLDEIALGSRTYFWSAIKYSDQPCAINVTP